MSTMVTYLGNDTTGSTVFHVWSMQEKNLQCQ